MEQKLGLLYVYEFCERDRKEFARCPNLGNKINVWALAVYAEKIP
jgi:hypothetical protein